VAEPSGAKAAAPRDAYRAAGVDVEAGERAVALMGEAVASTIRPEVIGGRRGFAGAIEIPARFRRPILVASTDGVGTKVALGAGGRGASGAWGSTSWRCGADDVACAGDGAPLPPRLPGRRPGGPSEEVAASWPGWPAAAAWAGSRAPRRRATRSTPG